MTDEDGGSGGGGAACWAACIACWRGCLMCCDETREETTTHIPATSHHYPRHEHYEMRNSVPSVPFAQKPRGRTSIIGAAVPGRMTILGSAAGRPSITVDPGGPPSVEPVDPAAGVPKVRLSVDNGTVSQYEDVRFYDVRKLLTQKQPHEEISRYEDVRFYDVKALTNERGGLLVVRPMMTTTTPGPSPRPTPEMPRASLGMTTTNAAAHSHHHHALLP
ncbi:hypothetical protein BV898_10886 [Hypsibius exemplaris]|uniref:Uncharacterized protein n=1 Tax=Hypsibius exemplaris TaxID=2072580 RepID=A0A1W0WIH5_HYPEX|nr:hypothetical protein BV898_10886 [Hypsibius exemplaris]